MKNRAKGGVGKAPDCGKSEEKSKEKCTVIRGAYEKLMSEVHLPKVFLRVYPYACDRVSAKEGCITFESPKVMSYVDHKHGTVEDYKRVNYCHFSQIFSGFTPQKHVLHSSALDPLQCFVEGGSSVMFFQAERTFRYHTTVGTASDSGLVPKIFGLIFDTLEGFMPAECEFKLSRDTGKIRQLTAEERESERAVREKIFSTLKPTKQANWSVNPDTRKQLVVDFGSNFLYASAFAIFDNNAYDLFEASAADGPPPPIQNWQNSAAGEFPLSHLCQNVHVLVKTEAMQLFLLAMENYENCISAKHFDPRRALFVYCLTNLRCKKDKGLGRVVAYSFGVIIFPALASSGKSHNCLDSTVNYVASTSNVMRQLKESSKRQPKPMPKSNMLGGFLQNMWFRNRCISMIINLRIEPEDYRSTVAILRKSCIKMLTVNCHDLSDVLNLRMLDVLKEPKATAQKESLADDVNLKISLKWRGIQEKAKTFNPAELRGRNVTLGPKNPFLEVYFFVDTNHRRRIVFPQLNSWFVDNFDAEVQEIRFLKVKVMILKILDSVLEELSDGCKKDFAAAKDICAEVKAQLMERGKLDETQKENVLTMVNRQVDGLVFGNMCFRILEEMTYLREVIENDFQYI